jgi:NADH-quinone oxidoreductase subunit J
MAPSRCRRLSEMSNTQALGDVLYTDYIFFFQIAGLVLLVAMIGAIVLTLRHANVKRQAPGCIATAGRPHAGKGL